MATRTASKLLLVFGLILCIAAVAVLGFWGKREADFQAKFTKMGGGPDTQVVSGGPQTYEQVNENGRWKLVRVDRGFEGELTHLLLYAGAVVGLAGVGLVVIWWFVRRRHPVSAAR